MEEFFVNTNIIVYLFIIDKWKISYIDSYYRYKNKLKINDNLGFLNKIKRV